MHTHTHSNRIEKAPGECVRRTRAVSRPRCQRYLPDGYWPVYVAVRAFKDDERRRRRKRFFGIMCDVRINNNVHMDMLIGFYFV